MLFMAYWNSHSNSPYTLLILGCASFCAAVVWTCTGKARTRFHGWVYRTQEPIVFWLVVATYYLGGILFVGIFLHDVYGHWN
jgi:hypothetical protein